MGLATRVWGDGGNRGGMVGLATRVRGATKKNRIYKRGVVEQGTRGGGGRFGGMESSTVGLAVSAFSE